jgi:hypothetical protein
MPRRPSRCRPDLERLEPKQLPSAGLSGAELAGLSARAHAVAQQPRSPVTGVTLERITNPTPFNAILKPPFDHVLVQSRQPVPGQVYNVLFITVRNSTNRTFTAGDNLTVKITNQGPNVAFPILSGDRQWVPGQRMVFYLLTKKYYPLSPVQSAGFEFNFANPRVVAIPGPSGIFLRVRYNPATFDSVLDKIVVKGPGAKGQRLGLPDTSLWELIPAGTAIPL